MNKLLACVGLMILSVDEQQYVIEQIRIF